MPRFILGVTGNIAVGKSTVVKMLADKGARHIDADAVYHDLIAPGQPLLHAIVEHFGDEVLAADGNLNRKALGAIVFNDPKKLQELDALTHPAVIAESDRRAMAVTDGVVILDAVKLIESGHADVCDAVWLVTAPEESQTRWLMSRNNLDWAEATRRIAAQPPLAPKRARADLEISNNGSIADLRQQVEAAWETIPAMYRIPQGHADTDQHGKMKAAANTASRKGTLMKITVWFDFVCPYAWTAQRWLFDLQSKLGDELEIEWRYFSIEQVNKAADSLSVWDYPNDGTSSTLRSFQAAHAAGKQGHDKFLAYMAALFNQRHINKRNLGTQRILEETAETVGLDLERFREDLKSDEVFSIFKKDHTEAVEKYGIFGVPTIMFENELSAYLRIKVGEPPTDPVVFWEEFMAIARNRPTILEIKRPDKSQG